jgi:hypothetical protein
MGREIQYVMFQIRDGNNTVIEFLKRMPSKKKKTGPWKPTYMTNPEILYFHHSHRFVNKIQIPKPKI